MAVIVVVAVLTMCMPVTMRMLMLMLMLIPMTVSRAAMVRTVSATFRLEGFFHSVHNEVHRPQHLSQHRIGFNFEVIGFEFYGHMSIAQVIRRTSEVKRRTMRSTSRNAQQALWRRFYFDQAAIVCHQHITAAHHMASLQKHRQHTAAGIFGLKATLLSNIPI